MVNILPAQMTPLLTDTVGMGSRVTFATAAFKETQPKEFVPVTEYDAFANGMTVDDPLE